MTTAGSTQAAGFRHVIGHFTTGVAVITTHHGGTAHGMTASAVSSLSLDPPMLLVCANTRAPTQAAILAAGRFAVNILGERQDALAARFAGPAPDKFAGVPWHEGALGLPLLDGALGRIECDVADVVVGGTHRVFLGAVASAEVSDGSPLAYFRGRFGRLEGSPEGWAQAALDVATSDEALEAKAAIDLAAAGAALERASDDQLRELVALACAIPPAADAAAHVDATEAFHERMVELAGNRAMVRVHRGLSLADISLRVAEADPGDLDRLTDDHVAIARALAARDRDVVRALLAAHSERGRDLHRRAIVASGGML